MIEKFTKVIIGFVSQDYEKQGDKFVCVGQEFIEGDDVSYEDDFGEALEDEPDEVNFVRDMVQPGRDYWFIRIWGCVELEPNGPYATEKLCDEAYDKMYEADEGEKKHTFHRFDVPKGTKINF